MFRKIRWKAGKKAGELFYHHRELGPLVADVAQTWVQALKLNAKVAFSDEGWQQLFRAWIMSTLVGLNPRLANEGTLDMKRGIFMTPEGWEFVILDGHPYRLDVPKAVEVQVLDLWKQGVPEGAEFKLMELYPRVPSMKGYYCSPSDLFQHWDKVVADPGKSVLPVCGASATFKDGKKYRRYKKEVIDGEWTLESEGVLGAAKPHSASIDAGMPGNEDGAWGSSSSDGWRTD